MFECSDSMSYYGQETTCMVPIVIGKCDYSYFLEFGYSFFIVGAKPHSTAALLKMHEGLNIRKIFFSGPLTLFPYSGYKFDTPLPLINYGEGGHVWDQLTFIFS